ncbi:MAG: hypothetical protein WDW38_006505 [Sanguina aurantia]
MEASWDYLSKLCIRAEEIGYDLTLVAELNLNDIKGISEPALDAWSSAAALAAVTKKLSKVMRRGRSPSKPFTHAPGAALAAGGQYRPDLRRRRKRSRWCRRVVPVGIHRRRRRSSTSTTTATAAPTNGCRWSTGRVALDAVRSRGERALLIPMQIGEMRESDPKPCPLARADAAGESEALRRAACAAAMRCLRRRAGGEITDDPRATCTDRHWRGRKRAEAAGWQGGDRRATTPWPLATVRRRRRRRALDVAPERR